MADTTRLSVSGMSCQGCVRSVTNILSNAVGVDKEQVQVDLEQGAAQFPTPADPARVDEAITQLGKQGFEAKPIS